MYKKRGQPFSSRKAQITMFIIAGMVLLLIFFVLLQLTSSVQRDQLRGSANFDQVFGKEALRIFVEDCLKDSFEEGLILIGKQGRIWSDQPGGVAQFVEGKTGVLYNNGKEDIRVAFAITTPQYSQNSEAFPCSNDQNSPSFCQYSYPNTSIGFGDLKIRASTIRGDLSRFLGKKTQFCVENYMKSEISSQANIEAGKAVIDLSFVTDGILVKADYPLKFSVEDQDYFHLSTFDFFYPSKFNQLLDSALIKPLENDFRYVDFGYTKETLAQPSFIYGNPYKFQSCESTGSFFFCQRNLELSKYKELGVQMERIPLAGADLFIFTPTSSEIIRGPEPFKFNFARQNRPPALDYVNRSSCLAQEYDYLVIPGHEKLGTIDITPLAYDPDEDKVTYSFGPTTLPTTSSSLTIGVGGSEGQNSFKMSASDLESVPSGMYKLVVRAQDGNLEDNQSVRILVDSPINPEASLYLPYIFRNQDISSPDKYLTYSELYTSKTGYVISKEDPIFLNVSFPNKPRYSPDPSLTLTSQGENVFGLDISKVIGGDSCFFFPGGKANPTGCDFNLVSNSDFSTWVQHPNQKYAFSKEDYGGKLLLDFETNYCSDNTIFSSTGVNIQVQECLPNVNASHPFAYPNHKMRFAVKGDGTTDFNNYLGEEEIHPLLATHSCCSASGTIKKNDAVCFESPVDSCGGNVPGLSKGKDYIQEQEIVSCDSRGNVCDGKRDYELPGGRLRCANNDDQCKNVDRSCRGELAFSYIKEEGVSIGWCSGVVGCSNVCTDAFVALGEKPTVTNTADKIALQNIKNNKVSGFQCGCDGVNDADEVACDQNRDGEFDGVCQDNVCVE